MQTQCLFLTGRSSLDERSMTEAGGRKVYIQTAVGEGDFNSPCAIFVSTSVVQRSSPVC